MRRHGLENSDDAGKYRVIYTFVLVLIGLLEPLKQMLESIMLH